tara:strand:- start:37056 stop:38423 length:1368 start_codon:yes stop_codon:yes gene_type:complete
MTKKWNLQDIRPAEPRRPRRPARPEMSKPRTAEPVEEFDNEPEETSGTLDIGSREHVPNIIIEDGVKKANNRLVISVVLFVVIVGGAIGLSALMGKTELTIYPENRQPNISAEFIAYPDQRENALGYEVLTLEATGERQVAASGQVQVEEQATGVIEIIKTTAGAERLIKNTRFRSPDGLIFRIQESVVVPGAVVSGDGSSVPGTIQAEVFAEEAGEEYNLAAGTRFDIPGFEEGGFTELFNAISARNPEALSGGFSGPQFQIDPDELSTARQALQLELRNGLLQRIDNEKPAGFIAFPNAVAMTFNELPAVEYGDDLVTIREQAILQIPLFQMTEFGSFLANEAVATYDGGDVRVDDPSVITFTYTNATTSSSIIANETSLSFTLNGRPLLIWEYDGLALARDLAGLPKTAIRNAVEAYPGIKEARAHITPFWKRNFPEDPEEIIIIEELKDNE